MGADGVEGDEEGDGGLFHREPGGEAAADFGFALGEVEELLQDLGPGQGVGVRVEQLHGDGGEVGAGGDGLRPREEGNGDEQGAAEVAAGDEELGGGGGGDGPGMAGEAEQFGEFAGEVRVGGDEVAVFVEEEPVVLLEHAAGAVVGLQDEAALVSEQHGRLVLFEASAVGFTFGGELVQAALGFDHAREVGK